MLSLQYCLYLRCVCLRTTIAKLFFVLLASSRAMKEECPPATSTMEGKNLMPVRILLADDHEVVREGFRALLEDHGFQIVGEAGNFFEAEHSGNAFEGMKFAKDLVDKLRADCVLFHRSFELLDSSLLCGGLRPAGARLIGPRAIAAIAATGDD